MLHVVITINGRDDTFIILRYHAILKQMTNYLSCLMKNAQMIFINFFLTPVPDWKIDRIAEKHQSVITWKKNTTS